MIRSWIVRTRMWTIKSIVRCSRLSRNQVIQC